ncbi:MAG: YggS family pyridoxal phosphate-dependent enzyme [Candidatus Omnitrophota bacterium]
MMSVKEKLERVRAAMAEAAGKGGRSAGDITLVAVTKAASSEMIVQAREAGLSVFGENKVQEAEVKIPQAGAPAEWHLVGHLQSNKVRPAVSLFDLIQSVDSTRLAKMISDESAAQGKVMPVLLEVNISGQARRFGFSPEEIYAGVEAAAGMPGIRVTGLMGIAPHPASDDEKRASFRKLKSLFSVCKTLKRPNVEMRVLSMGMSDDYRIAIEEGSNMIRLGRAIFA